MLAADWDDVLDSRYRLQTCDLLHASQMASAAELPQLELYSTRLQKNC